LQVTDTIRSKETFNQEIIGFFHVHPNSSFIALNIARYVSIFCVSGRWISSR
jgi:hypothetical protein